jgi:hypothetical protein
VIGAHALTSKPASYAGVIDPDRKRVSFGKPQGKTVDVTSWDWAGGSVRGVVLGPGPTTSTEYYGYFNGVGMSYFPELRITYTK